jgi:hypothetical protein
MEQIRTGHSMEMFRTGLFGMLADVSHMNVTYFVAARTYSHISTLQSSSSTLGTLQYKLTAQGSGQVCLRHQFPGATAPNGFVGYSYCVAGPAPPGTPTTTVSSSVSTTRPQPTAPTFSGQPTNCVSWYTVADGDSCSSVADKFFITPDQFFA